MKLRLTLLLFVLIPVMGFGQINSSVDFIGGIEQSYLRLSNPNNSRFVDIRDSRNQGKLSWRIGFNYNKKLAPKLFFKTGLRLANIGYKTKVVLWDFNSSSSGWGDVLNGGSYGGFIIPMSERNETILKTNYLFIEIPIAARFEFNDGKLSPFFEAGFSPSYYLATKAKLIDADIDETTATTIDEGSKVNRLQIVSFASLGVNYLISDNIQLFGQSIFRYHLIKTRDSEIKEYLYNYGLEIGVRKKIN